MLDNSKKEVFFELYCDKCEYADASETSDPCNDCLAYPYNINSHKPIHFKEKIDEDRGRLHTDEKVQR